MYTAASGALVAQSAVDTIANNLANVDTAGFKRTLLQVQAQPQRDVYRFQTDPGTSPNARTGGVAAQVLIGTLGSGAQIYDTPADYQQGAVAATGNDFDVALSGPGFFATRAGNGAVRYTRDGAFMRDQNGFLTAQNGDRVLGEGGAPIALPQSGKVEIARDGTVSVDGRSYDRLNVVEFANVANLRPEGSNRFVDAGGAGPRAATNTSALQGSLEKSNADVVRSMVDLIANERWFEANEKSIKTQDDAVGEAIQTVGRSNA
ncbi:MAG: flagellar basal-body rod protein FlgF [Candidatus Eremiobacteraeota bacterium]|jgi:flagellar basal-body rod protein FlgG|nr:flagellar basal-body rod protein FlgF [Candidatus Eremiobacteraeota bacterium]